MQVNPIDGNQIILSSPQRNTDLLKKRSREDVTDTTPSPKKRARLSLSINEEQIDQQDDTPGTENDEREIARSRRRRQSLQFRQRRKSLTFINNKAQNTTGSGTTSGNAPPPPSRQYISDMYSTIIQMSSENKINVKNSWSLHLIDHIDDILGSKRKEDGPNNFNFQKASCTLDASIKIYSYRVDDTYNSSYKILENLSRTDDRHGNEENDDNDPEVSKTNRKRNRGRQSAVNTIETNLNNINLKNYDLNFEVDPLFHKMSQLFDEGGAKGMLLANLSVYNGCKVLLNSADVSCSTRKTYVVSREELQNTTSEDDNNTNEGPTEAEDKPYIPAQLDLTPLEKLSCFSDDAMSLEVCPPLTRLYDQLQEFQASSQKVSVQKKDIVERRTSLLSFPPTPMHIKRLEDRAQFSSLLKASKEPSSEDDIVEAIPLPMAFDSVASDDENDGPREDCEMNNGLEMDTITEVDDEEEIDQNTDDQDNSKHLTSPAKSVDNVSDVKNHDMIEAEIQEPTCVSDFFAAKDRDEIAAEQRAFSSLLVNAVLKSTSSVFEIEDDPAKSDYSYFDERITKNWAGPQHWRRRRGVYTKQVPNLSSRNDGEEVEQDTEDNSIKKNSRKMTKTAAMSGIDFCADDDFDVDKHLTPPEARSIIQISKATLNKQTQKAAELVFPVDLHITVQQLLLYMMKPRANFFKKTLGSRYRRDFRFNFDVNDMNANGLDFSNGKDELDDTGGIDPVGSSDCNSSYDGYDGYADQDEQVLSQLGNNNEGLLKADRVVDKVRVHYERFAKRVDIRKLKGNIWHHLEHETPVVNSKKNDDLEEGNEDGLKRKREEDIEENDNEEITTFGSVVRNVSDKVPPNVTASFYFICLLHLANEKGLEFTGQEDLGDFQIRKDETIK